MKPFMLLAVALAWLIFHSCPTHAEWPPRTIGFPQLMAEKLVDIVARAGAFAAAKAAGNAEMDEARRRFFKDRVQGLRGSDAEQTFSILLLEKDIYFMSLFASEGMTPAAVKRVNAMDNVTGGRFDGGLPPGPAEDAFSLWVSAVRDALHAPPPPGILFPPSPAAFVDAINKSWAFYAKYRLLRDQAEFDRWHKSIEVQAPPARTPQEFADRYIEHILKPAIEQALEELAEGERPAAVQKVDAWRERLRQAIMDFEAVDITPEKVVDELRQRNYSEPLIQYFIETVDQARRSGAKNLSDVIIRAQQDIMVRQDRIRDPRLRVEIRPPPATLELHNLTWVYAHESGRLTADQINEMKLANRSTPPSLLEYLYGPGQPFPFPRETYWRMREYLRDGKVFTLPAYAKQCR